MAVVFLHEDCINSRAVARNFEKNFTGTVNQIILLKKESFRSFHCLKGRKTLISLQYFNVVIFVLHGCTWLFLPLFYALEFYWSMQLFVADGSTEFPAEKGRYHLYGQHLCPFSHRALIGRALKGLEGAISMNNMDYVLEQGKGWKFSPEVCHFIISFC